MKTFGALFWLPSRLLARAAGTVGSRRATTGHGRPGAAANDNIAVLAAKAANSNVPRHLA